MDISRSVVRYRHVPKDDCALRSRLKALAERYPRYGYPTLHAMLRREGLVQNRKRTYRIYTEEKLQVRTKKRKKLVRPRIPMVVPTRCNERWSIDFVSDQLSNGRRFRVLNVVDEFSRECVGQLIERQTRQAAFHSAGKTDTERLCGVVQWQVPRGLSQPALVQVTEPGTLHH